jgi:hypothetical protein
MNCDTGQGNHYKDSSCDRPRGMFDGRWKCETFILSAKVYRIEPEVKETNGR